VGPLRFLGRSAICLLAAATSFACAGSASEDPATDERVVALEAKTRSLEVSLEALARENAQLRSELAVLAEQAGPVEGPEAAGHAREQEEAVADPEGGREEQPPIPDDDRTHTAERLDDLDARVQELEDLASMVEWAILAVEQWVRGEDKPLSQLEGTALERTVRLAADSGAEVHFIVHPEREEPSVLLMPLAAVDGETPLIVSLHGYGGDSAFQAAYVPFHERVNTHDFALLLPNGIRDAEGNRFWNPTDECCDSAKGDQDDVAYLTELVARAEEVMDFGPVYFFGYSNGGFMAYHIACKGLPGLRAVASLAGTSYVEETLCGGASPVSVLHIHGTADDVIRFEGDVSAPDQQGDGEPAFYAGALDMVTRWSRRAGCDWPGQPQPYATLDLDRLVAGAETRAFRVESGCAGGIAIELWMSMGSSHAPGYGAAFVDALVDWLLSQE
jgi:polyhydroxybutyrate depolymerase